MLYHDAECTQPIENDDIDFGVAAIGISKEVTIFLKNDKAVPLFIEKISVDSFEVEVVSFDKAVKTNSVATITLRWTPSQKIESSMKTKIVIDGYGIW